MAQTLPNGVVVPNADGSEQISATGVAEMRTLGASVDGQLATKASIDYVDDEILKSRWFRGTLPSGSLDAVTTPGVYVLSSGNTYTGTPDGYTSGAAAVLVVELTTSGMWGTQTIKQYGFEQYVAARSATGVGVWPAVWAEDSRATREAGLRHRLRVDEFKRRRGGVIGTGGTGAVAFRFDHYYQNWRDTILPLMRQHGIVGSMAMHGTGSGTGVGAAGYDWADLQATHINDGLEIMCHSYDHQPNVGAANLEREIVWSRDNWLATRMPNVLIEGWMQPGAGYGSMGHLIDSRDKLWQTLAGRMLLANYAVVSGHRDGYYRQLTGDVDAGLAHVTIESDTTAANAKSIIDQAVRSKTGVVFMLHPDRIGQSGFMSAAVLGEIFAYVAQLRDAGKLANLTVGGMSLADAWTDRREDLAVNGSFTDGFDGWSAGTGWTVANGRALSPANTASTATISQSEYISRRSVIAGSPREVVVTARGLGGSGILRVTVEDSTGGTALSTYTDLVFTSGTFQSKRLFFTIPWTGGGLPQINLRWTIQQRGSSRVEIDSVQVRSI